MWYTRALIYCWQEPSEKHSISIAEHSILCDSSIPLPGIDHQRCVHMFTEKQVHTSSIHKSSKVKTAQCPSTVDKWWHNLYSGKLYTLRMNKLSLHVSESHRWDMEQKRSQTLKISHSMVPFIWNSYNSGQWLFWESIVKAQWGIRDAGNKLLDLDAGYTGLFSRLYTYVCTFLYGCYISVQFVKENSIIPYLSDHII